MKDEGYKNDRSTACQTYAGNPRTLYTHNITRQTCNVSICVVTQRKDAAITKTIVKDAAELEDAREDYPKRVHSGDELSETAEYN